MSIREELEAGSIPEPNSGCRLWEGTVGSHGYGILHQKTTHTQSWIGEYGPVPKGLCVLHKCDVRICVEPTHLYVGTRRQNMRDKYLRNRANHATGERHASAKLTEAEVRGIRSDLGRNVDVASKYSVSASLVCNIRKGRVWKHLLEKGGANV